LLQGPFLFSLAIRTRARLAIPRPSSVAIALLRRCRNNGPVVPLEKIVCGPAEMLYLRLDG
jgi:hypothetical protein